jgi:hypothetical protein
VKNNFLCFDNYFASKRIKISQEKQSKAKQSKAKQSKASQRK